MGTLLVLAVIVGAAVILARVALGLLADRWGIASRADACAWALAMVLPLPGRTAADLMRILARRLSGLRFVTAAGNGLAYGRVTVYVDVRGVEALEDQYELTVIERELAASYLEIARKAGWGMPAEPVAFDIVADERLARGRLFVEGRSGPVDSTPARQERPTKVATLLETELRTVALEEAEGRRTVRISEADTVLTAARLRVRGLGHDRLLGPSARHLLGRDRECSLSLTDTRVSRQHAELWHDAGAWWLRDIGSSNGTCVDGRQAGTSAILIDGPRTVLLGGCALRLEPLDAPTL